MMEGKMNNREDGNESYKEGRCRKNEKKKIVLKGKKEDRREK